MRLSVEGIQLAVRAALGAGVSLVLADLLRLDYPIYAMLAAVIVTDLSAAQTRQLGLRRLLATAVGATCGALLVDVLPSGRWSVALAILVAMLTCLVLRTPEVAKVAGYTCGIVVLAYGPESWTYAVFRFVETALGIGVAWLISLVPKLLRAGSAETGRG